MDLREEEQEREEGKMDKEEKKVRWSKRGNYGKEKTFLYVAEEEKNKLTQYEITRRDEKEGIKSKTNGGIK